MSTVLVLFGGIAGSVVASATTFAAAVWTLRATRNRDQEREDERADAADLARRNEVIAQLIGTLRDVELEIRGAPFRHGRSEGAVLRASMRFYLEEKPSHPLVARWVLARQGSYSKVLARWQRWWWVVPLHRWLTRGIGDHLGKTLGVLVLWSTGDLADDDFPADGDALPVKAEEALAQA